MDTSPAWVGSRSSADHAHPGVAATVLCTLLAVVEMDTPEPCNSAFTEDDAGIRVSSDQPDRIRQSHPTRCRVPTRARQRPPASLELPYVALARQHAAHAVPPPGIVEDQRRGYNSIMVQLATLDFGSIWFLRAIHSLLGCMISCRVHENRSIFSAAISAAMRRYSVPLTVLYTVKTRVEVGAAGVHTEVNCEGGQQSHDGARTFSYTASLCEASKHRGCGECCNENDVVALADGKSLMSVWRMGAGDGLIWNKSLGINGSYHFYHHAVSSDGGQTWWMPAEMPPRRNYDSREAGK